MRTLTQYYRAGIKNAASFAEAYGDITIKDTPGRVLAYFNRSLQPAALKKAADDYAAKHIDNSSVVPLHHAMLGIFAVSLLMSMPHAAHERDERLEKKYGKGWNSWF